MNTLKIMSWFDWRPARAAALAASAVMLSALAALPADSVAQESSAPAEQAAPAPDRLSAPQLEQLLAPIALYPDSLLSQILMASTYPLEVIEAYRWVSDPNNAALRGSALEAALQVRDWDPSVKSLVPFPNILKIMNDKLGWIQQLGNAFLVQEEEVMDAVQRLRSQAAAAGNLQTNSQQVVETQAQNIVIAPASTEVVYVPVYDPLVVYGAWPWPDYPPVYFAPFPGYAIHTGAFTWFSFGTIGLYWGWSYCDWHRHDIHIDRQHYNRIIAYSGRPSYLRDTWEHDPYHRRGVPYRDPALSSRYRPNPSGSPASRRDWRGYQTPARSPVNPATRSRTTVQEQYRTGTPNPPETRQAPRRVSPQERTTTRPYTPPARTAPSPAQTRQVPQRQFPASPAPSSNRYPTSPVTRAMSQPGPQPIQVQQVPPAFENIGSGAAARAEAQRARDSRQAPQSPPGNQPPRNLKGPRVRPN